MMGCYTNKRKLKQEQTHRHMQKQEQEEPQQQSLPEKLRLGDKMRCTQAAADTYAQSKSNNLSRIWLRRNRSTNGVS